MGTRPPSVLFGYAAFLFFCGLIGIGLTGFHDLQHILGLRPTVGILLLGLIIHLVGRHRLLVNIGIGLSMMLIVVLGLNYARLSYKWYQLGEPHQYYFLVGALAAMGSIIALPMVLTSRLRPTPATAHESPKVPQVSLVTAAVDLFGLARRSPGVVMIRRLQLPLGLILLAVGFIATTSSRQPRTSLAGGMESEAVARDHERLIRQLQDELDRRQKQLARDSSPSSTEEPAGDARSAAATIERPPAPTVAMADQDGPAELIDPETLTSADAEASHTSADDTAESDERVISVLQSPGTLDAINVFAAGDTGHMGMNAVAARQWLEQFAGDMQQVAEPAVDGRNRDRRPIGWSERSIIVRELPGRVNTRVSSKINSRVPPNRISWRIGPLRINGQSDLTTYGPLEHTKQVPIVLLPSTPADIPAQEPLESVVKARGIARIVQVLTESHIDQSPPQPQVQARPQDQIQHEVLQVQQVQPQPAMQAVADAPVLDEAPTIADGATSTEITSQPIIDDEPVSSYPVDLHIAPAYGRMTRIQIDHPGTAVTRSKWLTHLAGPTCIFAGLLAIAASLTRRSSNPHPI